MKSYLNIAVSAEVKNVYGLRKILKLKFLLELAQVAFCELLGRVMLDQEGMPYLYFYLVFNFSLRKSLANYCLQNCWSLNFLKCFTYGLLPEVYNSVIEHVNSDHMTAHVHVLKATVDFLVVAGALQVIFMFILMWRRYREFREMVLISAQQYQSFI